MEDIKYFAVKNTGSPHGEWHLYDSDDPNIYCGRRISRENRIHLGNNEDDARIRVAKLQNRGRDICGNCVSHLYLTD